MAITVNFYMSPVIGSLLQKTRKKPRLTEGAVVGELKQIQSGDTKTR